MPPDLVDPDSYALVAAEVDRELAARDADLRALDAKLAATLAFAGALAAFAPAQTLMFVRLGRGAAVVAAVVAVQALVPRKYPVLKPQVMRTYLGQPGSRTQLKFLDTKIAAATEAGHVVKRKSGRLKWAIRVLTASIALVGLGSAVDAPELKECASCQTPATQPMVTTPPPTPQPSP